METELPSRPREPRATNRRPGLAETFTVLVVSAALVGLGLVNGGFFPRAWSWASFGLVWLLAMLVLVREQLSLTDVEAGALAVLAALAGWTLASASWSPAVSQSVQEAERGLLYLVALALVLLFGDALPRLLGGVLLAIVCITGYALGRYLFFPGSGIPDRFEGYLLFRPVGYANALGILAAIGVALAAGFILHSAATAAADREGAEGSA
jgi:hypothetical protein